LGHGHLDWPSTLVFPPTPRREKARHCIGRTSPESRCPSSSASTHTFHPCPPTNEGVSPRPTPPVHRCTKSWGWPLGRRMTISPARSTSSRAAGLGTVPRCAAMWLVLNDLDSASGRRGGRARPCCASSVGDVGRMTASKRPNTSQARQTLPSSDASRPREKLKTFDADNRGNLPRAASRFLPLHLPPSLSRFPSALPR
jgi:hypothetical protein